MKIIYICFACFLLTSCTLYSKPVVIYPSDSLLVDCSFDSPPKLTGKDSNDKVILASAWASQTDKLGECNKKLKFLQQWKKVQIERFGDK